MCSLTLASCAPLMPQTRKDPTTDEYFGTTVPDPYRWLEDDLSTKTPSARTAPTWATTCTSRT
ncbi:MAG: hypothetical protein II809_07715 [Bacteroidales bacterium]|nr:hypothetical protein [Bacteroidales bacterium]MBQ6821914.1 hypothetical protein [Bacteroidales bacterium]